MIRPQRSGRRGVGGERRGRRPRRPRPPRRARLIGEGERLWLSFALRLAAAAQPGAPVMGEDAIRLGGIRTPLDLGSNLPLRFFGRRGSIRTLSAGRLLGSVTSASEADAAALRGRIVVIGAAASGVGNTFATPTDSVLPGVEVLATGIATSPRGMGCAAT